MKFDIFYLYFYQIKNIKLHIVTDIKEKRKCLKRWLPEEEAKGLVAIQALYCLDTPEFW